MALDLASIFDAGLIGLKGIAIGGSLWSAGATTAGVLLLPSIYPLIRTSSKLATEQWAFYYSTLSNIVPKWDLCAIAANGILAFAEHGHNPTGLAWKLWAVAAGLIPIGWMFVWTMMLEPSNKLLSWSRLTALEKEPEPAMVQSLLKEFNSLLSIRMLFPWVVGGLAFCASQCQ